MKKEYIKYIIAVVLFVFLSFKIYANENSLSDLFEQYLQKICKIIKPPKNQTYIVFDLGLLIDYTFYYIYN
jgi:hypothetical protein